MCGIAGILTSGRLSERTGERIKRMTDVLAHRGPDGEGFYFSEDKKLALGHRRLAVLDLTQTARQPMEYLSRYAITYNGEIYNYIELKEILQKRGYAFSSSSDTEVLLALYDWKKENSLEDLDGMFAFAIYDKKEGSLFCARDRFGEKPFYYSTLPGEFLFASEMKALVASGCEKRINRKMLYNYLAWNYISNPSNASETFYEGVKQLPPAHSLLLNKNLEIKIRKYWEIDYKKQNTGLSVEAAAEECKKLLYESVARRLRSDVPVGSSLSGGLDSSIIVSVIDDLNRGKGKRQATFSARFGNFEKDEGKFIDLTVKKTRAQAHAVYPTGSSFLKNIETIFYHQEEPFLSASVSAQFEVMQLARLNGTKVLLDGQGADELFGGYDYLVRAYFQELRSKDLKQYKAEWKKYSGTFSMPLERGLKFHSQALFPGTYQKLEQVKKWIKPKNYSELNQAFAVEHAPSSFRQPIRSRPDFNFMLYESTTGDAMQQILRYADRNSMANSVEVRLPFLSHRLAEFAFALPPSFKIREGWPKYLLRKSFESILSPEITWRRGKTGFEAPQAEWMRESMVREKIREAKSELVKEKILSEKSLQKNSFDWRYWMAGLLLGR